jgi:serine/threonine transporter
MLSDIAGASNAAPGALGEVFRNIVNEVVSNPVKAIMNANYLSILFWAIITGLSLKKLANENTIRTVHDFAESVSLIVKWIIQCAPFGIMGLVYGAVSESGLEIFTTYGKLLLLLVGCMLAVSLIINPIIVAVLIRRNPYPLLWQCLKESAVSAFFTRSSAANIPVNMDLCKRMGVDEVPLEINVVKGFEHGGALTHWSQSNGGGGRLFNLYTPNNSVCGCVATAAARGYTPRFITATAAFTSEIHNDR